MKIRKANINDLDNFYSLFQKLVQTKFSKEYSTKTLEYFIEEDFSKQNFKRWLMKKEKQIHLAEDEKMLVAFLIVSKPYGGTSWGHWLAVDEKYQRKGIASSLLKMWEKNAIGWGCHMLHLITEKRNLNFYTKRGFIYMGMIPKNYFGTDDYYFYKKIAEPKEENYLREYLQKKRNKTSL